MTHLIEKSISKKKFDEIIKSIIPSKSKSLKKFSGLIKKDIDPLKVQSELRDEWK